MQTVLDKVKSQLQKDPAGPNGSWERVMALLANVPPTQRYTIMTWIFGDHKGYVDPRAQAGREVLAQDPPEGWLILGRLVASGDPDDRDVALTLLAENGSDRAAAIAHPLLMDPYAYLRLEAARFLQTRYPVEARDAVTLLRSHHEPSIRAEAEELLRQME